MVGDFRISAQRSRGDVQEQVVYQVVVLPQQFLVRFLLYIDLDVARHSVASRGMAFALHGHDHSVAHSGRDFHFHDFLAVHHAFAPRIPCTCS